MTQRQFQLMMGNAHVACWFCAEDWWVPWPTDEVLVCPGCENTRTVTVLEQPMPRAAS